MRYILIFIFAAIPLFSQENWQNYLRLGQYYEKSQQPEEALKNYEMAWRRTPAKENVYTLYFNFASRTGIWEKADEISAFMLKKQPKSTRYINDYGRSLAMLDRKEEADSLWQSQLTRKDLTIADIQSMANAMLQARLFDSGVQLLETGYIKFPKQHSILLQIASLYQSRLSYKKAVDYYLRYLKYNPGQYNLIQSRILNMLDNWDDGYLLAEYIQDISDNTQGELISSIYLKFKQYDKAYPLLIENYDSKTGQKYFRYVQYARLAQIEGNAQFALDLLTFLTRVTNDAQKSNDLLLTRYEIKYKMIPKNASIDMVETYIAKLDKFYENLGRPQKIRTLKLYVQSYHYLLNDLDKAMKKAMTGSKLAQTANDKDYFFIELIKISFEKSSYKNIGTWQKQIRSLELVGEAFFYQILAGFEENGLGTVKTNINFFIRKFKPDHSYYQDVVNLQAIMTLADSSDQKLLIKAMVLFYQKKYARAENRYGDFIDSQNQSVTLSLLALDFLYDIEPFTNSGLFIQKANQTIERFSGHPANAKILWQISILDPLNTAKYYEQILEFYPESLEADKVRNIKKRTKATLG